MDCDSALFTCVKMIAQSFIFLGGLQLNYRMAFAIILGFFTLESGFEVLRILLSYWEFETIDDVVVTSKVIRTELRKHPLTVLEPNNVYEDLTRGGVIVTMVFITQCILIAFVVRTCYTLICGLHRHLVAYPVTLAHATGDGRV